MKPLRWTSVLVLFSLVLAACGGQQGGQPSATPAPEEAVTVTFWHAQSGTLGKHLQELIDKFNSSHRVQIKAEFKGNYTELFQANIAAIQAGSPPDMTMIPGLNQAAAYIKAKVLQPVQKFVDGPDGYTKDQLKDFYSAFLNDNRLVVDGKSQLVSWPLSKSMQVLYYNPGILERAGVTVPKTWTDLRETLKTVKQKVPNVTPLMYTADFYYFFLPLLRDNGGDVLTAAFDKAAFNTDAGRSALQYQVDLVTVDKTAVVTKGFDWQNPFAQGKVAFSISTSVSRPFIEQAMPANAKFQVGVAPLPAGDRKANNTLFGNNLLIFNKAVQSHQRGAWLFMKWTSELDQTIDWSLFSGYMPVRQSALTTSPFKDRLAQDPRVGVPLQALKDSQGTQASPDWDKITNILQDAITKALQPTGAATPRAALEAAEKKVNDTLKE